MTTEKKARHFVGVYHKLDNYFVPDVELAENKNVVTMIEKKAYDDLVEHVSECRDKRYELAKSLGKTNGLLREIREERDALAADLEWYKIEMQNYRKCIDERDALKLEMERRDREEIKHSDELAKELTALKAQITALEKELELERKSK